MWLERVSTANELEVYFQVTKSMKNIVLIGLLSAGLGGCTSTFPPEVLAYRDVANAHVGIRHTNPANIIGDYNHRDPVDPRPWRKLNDEQSPVKGGHS